MVPGRISTIRKITGRPKPPRKTSSLAAHLFSEANGSVCFQVGRFDPNPFRMNACWVRHGSAHLGNEYSRKKRAGQEPSQDFVQPASGPIALGAPQVQD